MTDEEETQAWKHVAKEATAAARQKAHNKGLPYVIGRDCKIIEVWPDGTEVVVKEKAS